jgi:hypothetical protein
MAENTYNSYAEAIQFGDVESANNALASAIDQRLHQHKEAQELARGNAAVARIKRERPEFDDHVAMEAAGTMAFDVLAEDLKRLGYDFAAWEKQLGRPPTNKEIADHHLQHRVRGDAVRSADEFLDEAVSRYDQWRRGEIHRNTGLEDMRPDVAGRHAQAPTVRSRTNQTRGLRGEAKLPDDYGTQPVERSAEDQAEISRRQATVRNMQQQRRAARSVHSFGGR